MELTAQAKQRISAVLRNAVQGEKAIPGATVVVVGKDGSELFVESAGKRGASSPEPMTPDNIFWIASCTKMLTGLACMQLVEKGTLRLDDSAQTEGFFPEWSNLKVLLPNGQLVDKKNGITLRMLLTHTAGFGYSAFNERLRDFGRPVGFDELSCQLRDLLQPLLFQPGEGWEYGINIDWAGLALERVTQMSLNDYIQANICKPLGLDNLSMFPSEEMKKHLVYVHETAPDGKVVERDHLLRRPLTVANDEEKATVLNSGGGGMFAKPQDYARVISVLLNDGTCPLTGTRLLQNSTVDDMFRNQIPQFPQFGRQGMPAAKPEVSNAIPDIYPTPGNAPQGWGLTFMLSGGHTGRSEGTACWAGLPGLYWWADRENGVGGITCAQVLPFHDSRVLDLRDRIEIEVYKGLKKDLA